MCWKDTNSLSALLLWASSIELVGVILKSNEIDLHLIDTSDMWGYFKLCGFKQALEAHFGIGVDVLTTGSMDYEVRESVLREEVMVFERA